jgi:hypothetical protein
MIFADFVAGQKIPLNRHLGTIWLAEHGWQARHGQVL